MLNSVNFSCFVSSCGVLILSKILENCMACQIFGSICLIVFVAFKMKLSIQTLISVVPTWSVFCHTTQFKNFNWLIFTSQKRKNGLISATDTGFSRGWGCQPQRRGRTYFLAKGWGRCPKFHYVNLPLDITQKYKRRITSHVPVVWPWVSYE